uniref:Si:ch211-168d23.3 n=1 Tax=Cyprinodon variegatus TaxID=28743 RepID=A0A3Q2D4V8_CYPVA
MEDEDGTCLLDVLDPQALNDFLHGTSETEDLLINSSSGEPSLFTDAPSPVSLLGDGRDCPDTPPPGCVDLSFLEEALLSSPEGGEDSEAVQPPVEAGCEAKAEGVGEAEVACDILQQSLQEAEITEQTMALEAGLAQTGDGLSLYSPAPLLSPPTVPFIPKSVTLPVATTLPRDTQAAVEPPQPSLLAVGPGCPSLKPAAPAQLMGLLPGNVFPAPSPDNSFSLSPAQGSSMIIHKAVPSVTTRPLLNPPLRAAAAPAPSIVLQRAPLPIQPKLPISIQPRLVQISPKPSGQKATSGLTFVPATASPNMLLSQAPGQKTVAPQPQAAQQLSKPVSLQLVNQGGSFVLQPQGLFQGQNQFLLPGQCPVTISQPVRAVQPLLTPSHQGPSVHSVAASTGQLVDGSQILTVPQRQLNFSPVFTTPTGQLALRQATVLSGSLQLQSAPATVFQMPAQLAGAYTAGGQGQQATLVHSPALGNHITLINSSGVLPQDLTSISIVNGPSVVQGLPFAAQAAAPQAGLTEGQLSLQRASVVLLPERPVQEERSISEEAFQFQQQLCLDHGAVQNPITRPAFTSLKDAVRCLLPYHTCAGHLPTQDDFNTDQEFDTVSGFLLKRTKDMVNKYRQLLQESPSAEMVMLERLFLQAERYALAEERRRARKDPGLSHVHSSSSPSSPPAWARLTERPPGLKTYRSSSRGALRLTIKQESGSRKVIHNSACDPGLKRDHTGQLTNGGGSVNERHLQATNGATRRHQYGEEMSDGVLSCNTGEQVQQTAAESQTKPPIPLPMTEPEDVCFEIATRDIGAPKLKCYRLDVSPQPEQHLSPASLPFQEDNILSEHLQSAIDSILELQRLQGPSTAPSRGASGPSLDQPVTSILEGHL